MRIRTRRIRIRRNRTRSWVVPRALVLALLVCLLTGGALSGVATAAAAVASANGAGSNLTVWDRAGVQGAFVGADGTVGPSFQISAMFGGTSSAATATDGTDHLVVWHHSVSLEGCSFREASSIMGAIVRSDATVSVPFTIAAWNGPCDVQGLRTLPEQLRFPRAGFDGTNYFVVWERLRAFTERTIEGARVTTDGTVLDTGGKTLVVTPASDYRARPHLAFDGTNFLVVYVAGGNDFHWIADAHGLFATRVNTLATPVALDPAGIPLSDPVRRNDPELHAGGVAFDGANWVVAWAQEDPLLADSPDASALMAARVTSAGAVLDPLGVPVVTESDHNVEITDFDGPAIVSDGSHLLVVYGRTWYSSSQAVLIDGSNTTFEVVKPPFTVPLGNTEAGRTPAGYLIVGERLSCCGDIDGIRITAEGEVLDPQPFPISGSDTTPPETTITSGPQLLTNETTATFEFGASETAWFECRVDSEPFSGCSSPMTFSNLTEGNHTFEVFARDSAGNVDATPATWSWTIDLSAPDTSISSGPPSLTNETTATFAFGSSETDATFECSLDGSAFSGCSSPATYAGLGDGDHNFEVRARDAAGNVDATSASWPWTIDSAAPGAVTLVSPANGNSTSDTTPSFDWDEAVDRSLVSYEIQADNGGSEFPSPEVNEAGLTTSDFTPSGSLAAGTYAWRVRATDAAGNVGAWSETFSFTITGPKGAIAGKVTSQSTRNAIAGATVDCGSAGSATTAADGIYTIPNVAAGSYTCTASASGHKSLTKSVTVTGTKTASANFALKKA